MPRLQDQPELARPASESSGAVERGTRAAETRSEKATEQKRALERAAFRGPSGGYLAEEADECSLRRTDAAPYDLPVRHGPVIWFTWVLLAVLFYTSIDAQSHDWLANEGVSGFLIGLFLSGRIGCGRTAFDDVVVFDAGSLCFLLAKPDDR